MFRLLFVAIFREAFYEGYIANVSVAFCGHFQGGVFTKDILQMFRLLFVAIFMEAFYEGYIANANKPKYI